MSVSRATPLGQLFMLGIRDHRWLSRLERTLCTIQPGGVLLQPGALRAPGETAQFLHQIANTLDTPPILAIAEEGGSVNPLKAFLPPLPAPRILARCGTGAVRQSAELIGAALGLIGFNLNFAPRLDLSNPDVKPAVGTQTYGTDPKQVAECGRAFIESLGKNKIAACGKHFPGRGVSEYDAKGFPIVGKSMAEMWREDLLPFRELLPRLPFVRLSSTSYKAYDFDAAQPAAMSSKVIHDLLRVKLGYRGVAVADLFELLTEKSAHVEADQGVAIDLRPFIHSIKAGCDLQVLMWGSRMADVIPAAVQREIDNGSLAQEHIESALQRIRAAKKGLKRPSGTLAARSFDRLAREFEEFGQRIRVGGEIEA